LSLRLYTTTFSSATDCKYRLAEATAKNIIEAFQLYDLPRNSPNETIAGTAASAIVITPNAAILA
jgi:hypothetical protein